MSWYNPTSWFVDSKSRDYAPGAKYAAGTSATSTNADIEAAKAKRVANGQTATPMVYKNGFAVRANNEVPGASVDKAGTQLYAPQTISDQTGEALPWQVSDATRQNLLAQQGALAGQFAGQAQQGYNQYGQQGNAALAALQAQAQGQNSVSALQLQQGLQQNLAAQRSLAAGAAPQNSAGAARTAAIQSGRLGAGLSGAQSVAGLQERNQAQQQYSGLLQQLRGQDLNAALSSRQNAETGYGAGMTGAPQKSWVEQYGPAIAAGAAAVSDRRAKTNVRDGDEDADKAIAGLRSFMFRYKNEDAHGKGDQLGVMAQDLERVGLKHAVMDTPGGKVVHGAKLATANTAMISALGRRLAKLEGASK